MGVSHPEGRDPSGGQHRGGWGRGRNVMFIIKIVHLTLNSSGTWTFSKPEVQPVLRGPRRGHIHDFKHELNNLWRVFYSFILICLKCLKTDHKLNRKRLQSPAKVKPCSVIMILSSRLEDIPVQCMMGVRVIFMACRKQKRLLITSLRHGGSRSTAGIQN